MPVIAAINKKRKNSDWILFTVFGFVRNVAEKRKQCFRFIITRVIFKKSMRIKIGEKWSRKMKHKRKLTFSGWNGGNRMSFRRTLVKGRRKTGYLPLGT
jgi:hypothetical protein